MDERLTGDEPHVLRGAGRGDPRLELGEHRGVEVGRRADAADEHAARPRRRIDGAVVAVWAVPHGPGAAESRRARGGRGEDGSRRADANGRRVGGHYPMTSLAPFARRSSPRSPDARRFAVTQHKRSSRPPR
ncbi:hypothetical protein [Nannocystis exedens]|uniref:hypothetical protein n=1 Tax=Nannocystis exedens TaxID=54 RepID=UPI001160DD81|nr:hypothetical protein [Nannocystis exedens]